MIERNVGISEDMLTSLFLYGDFEDDLADGRSAGDASPRHMGVLRIDGDEIFRPKVGFCSLSSTS